MEIRKATILDVNDISRIHALSWKAAYKGMVPQDFLDNLKEDFWVSTFENWMSNNAITVQIIYDKNLPVGCISYGKSRDTLLQDWAEIVSIYVIPNYFNKGFGKELLKTALTDIKNMGYKNAYLWVLNENIKAQNFYKNKGFSATDNKVACEISGKELIDFRYTIEL